MKPEKAQKIEKATGYVLLAIGLILMIISVCLVLSILLSGAQIPQIVPIPTGETSEYVKSMVIFSNVCLISLIFVMVIWAGSISSSRGVTMIKDVKLKLVRHSLREVAEIAEKTGTEES